MATLGQIGSGIKIAFASGSPQVWTAVTQILDVSSLPGIVRDQIETTTHGVTSLRKKIPGLGEVSDLEFQLLADLDTTSTHFSILDLLISQETRWWRVEIPNTSNLATTGFMAFQFEGKVQTWNPESPIDDKKLINVTVLFADNLMIQKTMTSQIS